MPTLEKTLETPAPLETFPFNIEIKSNPARPEIAPSPEEPARMALARIRKRALERRVIVQRFDFRTIPALKAVAPEVRRAAPRSSKGEGGIAVPWTGARDRMSA